MRNLTERQITALDCFRGERGGTTLDVAGRLKVEHTVAQRITQQLVDANMLKLRGRRWYHSTVGKAAHLESLRGS